MLISGHCRAVVEVANSISSRSVKIARSVYCRAIEVVRYVYCRAIEVARYVYCRVIDVARSLSSRAVRGRALFQVAPSRMRTPFIVTLPSSHELNFKSRRLGRALHLFIVAPLSRSRTQFQVARSRACTPFIYCRAAVEVANSISSRAV